MAFYVIQILCIIDFLTIRGILRHLNDTLMRSYRVLEKCYLLQFFSCATQDGHKLLYNSKQSAWFDLCKKHYCFHIFSFFTSFFFIMLSTTLFRMIQFAEIVFAYNDKFLDNCYIISQQNWNIPTAEKWFNIKASRWRCIFLFYPYGINM